jgi:hypothetical protein
VFVMGFELGLLGVSVMDFKLGLLGVFVMDLRGSGVIIVAWC